MSSPPKVPTQETAVDPSLSKIPHRDENYAEDDTEAQQDQSTPSEELRSNDVKKWYCRPSFLTAMIVLSVCIIVVAIVVPIVIMGQNGSTTDAPTIENNTTDPTQDQSTQIQIACNFLSIPNVTECRSTVTFDSDTTTGSTIPSEIGLLTQLTWLSFAYNQLTSTIPSEIGLLTQLTLLSFSTNQLTSTIPSELGRLTQLVELSFHYNELSGTIPSFLCSLTSLAGNIWIDCGEITCDSGCCFSGDGASCG
jgi:Leucine-rich repeat (LRR) protein